MKARSKLQGLKALARKRLDQPRDPHGRFATTESLHEQQAALIATAFDNAPPHLKTLGRAFQPPLLPPRSGESAFFDGNDANYGIHLNGYGDPDAPHAEHVAHAIYQHEWGHALDDYMGAETGRKDFWSGSPEAQAAFDQDEARHLKLGEAPVEEGFKHLAAMGKRITCVSSIDDPQTFQARNPYVYSDFVSDAAAALTNNQYGFGHSDAYFAEPGARQTELFANCIALLASGHPEARAAAHAIAPAFTTKIEQHLERLAKEQE